MFAANGHLGLTHEPQPYFLQYVHGVRTRLKTPDVSKQSISLLDEQIPPAIRRSVQSDSFWRFSPICSTPMDPNGEAEAGDGVPPTHE
jgi:hypothetical protein